MCFEGRNGVPARFVVRQAPQREPERAVEEI